MAFESEYIQEVPKVKRTRKLSENTKNIINTILNAESNVTVLKFDSKNKAISARVNINRAISSKLMPPNYKVFLRQGNLYVEKVM